MNEKAKFRVQSLTVSPSRHELPPLTTLLQLEHFPFLRQRIGILYSLEHWCSHVILRLFLFLYKIFFDILCESSHLPSEVELLQVRSYISLHDHVWHSAYYIVGVG
jgi:hypothetical protein